MIRTAPPSLVVDYAMVGGGLQNGLIALALLARRPDASVALIEAGPRLGGNHVWSFHEQDVSSFIAPILAPLIVRRWPGYRVSFPGFERRLGTAYASTNGERLDQVLRVQCARQGGAHILTAAQAVAIERNRVVLADGREISARVVIDARGPGPAHPHPGTTAHCAYQKFVGVELSLRDPIDDGLPMVMDADVVQHDGYRFVYVLPLEPRRVLVEDTYFSDTPELDLVRIRARIADYVRGRGWRARRVLRRESGVLPLPWRHAGQALPAHADNGPFRAGFGGGWFHPTTGYSFPAAAQIAALVATEPIDTLPDAWTALATRHRRQARYCMWLNRLLYRHVVPEARWQVLARFYRLPEPTIARFYALRLSAFDRLRIVCGRPPAKMSLWPVPPVLTTGEGGGRLLQAGERHG